ncbi:MAG: hypothetical protein M1436_06085 [Acidobacteria bacterium]|nr:hypothetical protein [Acidobacteriota bacterium]
MGRSPARWPLVLDGYPADAEQPFQVQAAWDLERNGLVLYVYNATPQTRVAEFDLARLGRAFKHARVQTLSAPDLLQVNTVKEPHPITRAEFGQNLNPGEPLNVNAAPFSFTELVLEQKN